MFFYPTFEAAVYYRRVIYTLRNWGTRAGYIVWREAPRTGLALTPALLRLFQSPYGECQGGVTMVPPTPCASPRRDSVQYNGIFQLPLKQGV